MNSLDCSWKKKSFSFGTSCGSYSWGCLHDGNTPAPHQCRISSWLGMFFQCRAVREHRNSVKRYISSALETSLLYKATWLTNLHVYGHSGRELLRDDDGVALSPCQSQPVSSVSWKIFQRDHSHSDQVTAVNTFIALCYNSFNTLKKTQTHTHTQLLSKFAIRNPSQETH